MPPAARIGDNHTCPITTLFTAHVGGIILPPCAFEVLINRRAAARVQDNALCFGPPDTISNGSRGVFIGHKKAARSGDPTVHQGVITKGSDDVFIGD